MTLKDVITNLWILLKNKANLLFDKFKIASSFLWKVLKILFKSIIYWFNEFFKLMGKEFLFKRYDEFTGRQLFTKSVTCNPGQTNLIKHEYRGVTLYLKEILESLLALILVVFFVFSVFDFISEHFVFIKNLDFDKLKDPLSQYSTGILRIAGGALILDSILLIAALISSPGIDETIDSISVTLAGVLLVYLGNNEENLFSCPTKFFWIIVPLSLLVILLVFMKHQIRRMSKADKNRFVDGVDE